ncbi:MAG: hypothetical protein E5W65_10875 [Mesorhizobium sp.]|nr:MAG: hypothetical protein E5W65_10875 [Mesorhizobium sp.]
MPIVAVLANFDMSGSISMLDLINANQQVIEWIDHSAVQTRIDLDRTIVITEPAQRHLTLDEQAMLHRAWRYGAKVRQTISL